MRVKFTGCVKGQSCLYCTGAFKGQEIASGVVLNTGHGSGHKHYMVGDCIVDEEMIISKFKEHKKRLCG